MKYYVYKITNLVNNKIYIGRRKHLNPNIDVYMGSGTQIKRAITKYGIENFSKEILAVFDSEKESAELEASLVTKDFCLREDTYNMHEGGYGGFSHINDNATKRKEVSKAASKHNKKNGVGGTKNWTELSVQKMLKSSWGNKIKEGWSPNNWAKMSEARQKEVRNKLSSASAGSGNSQFGTKFYIDCNNPLVKKRYKEGSQPEGWMWVEEYKEQRMKNSKRWYNDGSKNYYITLPNPIIKELGLVKGRIR